MSDYRWYPLKGYETLYSINKNGNIKSKRRKNKILSVSISRVGYCNTGLFINKKVCRKSIHRLVALTFIKNPLKLPNVNHKDGNKLNNNVNNLEWCTHSQNIKHAYKIGLLENPRTRKIKQIDRVTGKIIKIYNSIKEAANKTKTNKVSISRVAKKKAQIAGGYFWEYITS